MRGCYQEKKERIGWCQNMGHGTETDGSLPAATMDKSRIGKAWEYRGYTTLKGRWIGPTVRRIYLLEVWLLGYFNGLSSATACPQKSTSRFCSEDLHHHRVRHSQGIVTIHDWVSWSLGLMTMGCRCLCFRVLLSPRLGKDL